MRINKFIANCGVSSRRHAEDLIAQGRVKINGELVRELGIIVKESDVVLVDNKPISLVGKSIYIVMNKPRGVLTTCMDDHGRRTVIDLIPNVGKRVYPVGRLDYDTEGLLLLTNDGEFARRITHPSNEIQKTYIADVDTDVTDEHIIRLNQTADSATQVGTRTIQIIIHEGKNRQVRKMMASVGLDVVNLKRVAIGRLKLDLDVGEFICLDKPPII